MTLKDLENSIAYSFRKKELLATALTHKSYLLQKNDPSLEHNEKLEFLGDSVLDLIISDLLMSSFPGDKEGSLTKKRAFLVNEEGLCDVAKEIDLGSYIRLGRFESQVNLQENCRLLASALEAILGAAYIDGGFDATHEIVEKLFFQRVSKLTTQDSFDKDYKTRLQEIFQKDFKTIPQYALVDSTGPEHDKTFEVEVSLNEKVLAKSMGRSKKQAEQNVARLVLEEQDEL